MDKKIADEILAQTRRNYDDFAESFARTREYVPDSIAGLMANIAKKGDKVLDIGCGNGRLFSFFDGRGASYVGIDNSQKLVNIAQENNPGATFMVGDALALPFSAGEFDLAVSSAVLHHIPSKAYRQKFFQEARRILKAGGCFVVLVWDLRLPIMIKQKKWKLLQKFAKTQIKIALGAAKLDFGDVFISWQNQYQRYHRMFSLRELQNLAKSAGFAIEKFGALPQGEKEQNLYIIAKKMQN